MSETLEIGPEFIPRMDDTALPDPALVGEGDRSTPSGWRSMAENERDHIRRTLEFTGYNQSAAARLLEIDYRLLMRRIKKYNLKPTMDKGPADSPASAK